MSYFVLLSDSTEDSEPLNPSELTDREKELHERMQNASEGVSGITKDMGLGLITPRMPNSYYNLLCFIIAYKTGTSLKHVQNMTYFDFMSFLYIVGKMTEEGTPSETSPHERDQMRSLGLG